MVIRMKIVDGILLKIEPEDIVNGKLIIPEGVIAIEGNHEDCQLKATSIYFPKSLKKIGRCAFFRQQYIKNIFFQEGIEEIEEMAFDQCCSLENVYFPKSLKKIDPGAFYKCESMEHISLKNGLKEIGEQAFADCLKLEEVEIPNSVEIIKFGAFSNCKELKKVVLPENLKTISEETFRNCINITDLTLPNRLKIIGYSAFEHCESIAEVTLPNTLEEIGRKAFCACVGLKSIKIPDSVKLIAMEAFLLCLKLESVKLPLNISVINNGTFRNCNSLSSIEIPNTVVKIDEVAFLECSNLKKVTLSSNLQEIEKNAFSNIAIEEIYIPRSVKILKQGAFSKNSSLKRVVMEEGLQNIESDVFFDCSSLNQIKFPSTLERIGASAFQNCVSLEEIEVPMGVKKLEYASFWQCSSLKKIILHEDMQEIRRGTFGKCVSIREIITPWGSIDINSLEHNQKVKIAYLYLYANHILKDKYKSIRDFINNPSISDYFSTDNSDSLESIQKFKNLFYKLRKEYDIDKILFDFWDMKTTEEFSYPVWQEIKNVFPWKTEEAMTKAFAEMIEIFGLFHKDKNQKKRIEKFKSLFNEFPFKIDTHDFNLLRIENPWHFVIIETAFLEIKEECMKIEDAIQIPEEFHFYLKETLLEKDIQRIKKERGTFGKRLNDFVNNHYRKDKIVMYSLREEYRFDETIRNCLFNTRLDGHISAGKLHQIFDGCREPFSEDFYNFFIENLDKILEDAKIQGYIREINKKFQAIKSYYLMEAGVKEISLKQALDYMKSHVLDYHPGNYSLAQEALKAGIVSQETFDHYQELYEKNKERRLHSLIRRNHVYEIDGYTIQAELLRKDDPLNMFVGETNYTNCCQRHGGIGHNCMAHATSSDDGGIFVTRLLKDGEWILLTQSWDWQNNNLYCHDNIEGTEYLKEGPESLRKAVSEVLKLDAEWIIENSNKKVEEFIVKKKKTIEKLSEKDREKALKELEELRERNVIHLVTSGMGYDDLELENYFHTKIEAYDDFKFQGKKYSLKYFQPVAYDSSQIFFDPRYSAYSDAKRGQYVIAGSIKDLYLEKQEKIKPIYRDERRIKKIEQGEISGNEITKISELEEKAYPEKMKDYKDMEDVDFKDSSIYLGEDWYLIYENRENGKIYISDLARISPQIDDERGIQQQEIMKVLSTIIKSSDEVEADLKEDTSYILYLMNKRLGYIEQIGEDICYPFDDEYNRKVVTEEEQEELLKSRKEIENKEIMMHKVKFKKGNK